MSARTIRGVVTPANLTAGEILAGHARTRLERVGVRDLDRSLTYRDWNERACRLANPLPGLGLANGDRVAVLADNRLE